jgi:purine nucleosidase
MSSRVKMILDCDPGHDDAMAMVVAANHADLLGVTTVAGNAPITATTRNARIILDMIGSTAPLHQGAQRPLVAEPKDAAYVRLVQPTAKMPFNSLLILAVKPKAFG